MRIAVIFTAILLLTAGAGTALAQSPKSDAPTPGPDQKVFTGEVPAPPGTTVRLEVLDVVAIEAIVCATATTTAGADPESQTSRFVLILDRECAVRGQDPRVCWGPDACAFLPFGDPRIRIDAFEGGQTVELGLLAVQTPAVGIPVVGDGSQSDRSSSDPWLLWAGVAALAAGLAIGAGGLAVARKR